MTRCRHKDKHLLANWVVGGHLPNRWGQSGGIEGGGGGVANQGGQMGGGGCGGHSMQGGQETTEDEREQDGHDREPVEGQITPGGQDVGEEAGGGGLNGQENDPGGADGEIEVGPRTRSRTKRLRTFK